MSWSIVFQIAVLIGGMGAAGGGFTAFWSRRKISSDATAVSTGASIKQLNNMQTQLDKAQAKIDAQDRQMQKFRNALYAHQRWDYKVIQLLERNGVTDMETLTPPELWLA